MYLRWTDASLCENGFSFDRSGFSFTPNYDYQSSTSCFTAHAPSTIVDDLSNIATVPVGSSQTYCVRAYNTIGYAIGWSYADI